MEEMEAKWRAMSEGMISGLRAWREGHPQATLGEIEQTIDERLWVLRAQMIEDTALSSAARDWGGQGAGPSCPACGTGLKVRGQQQRQLQTHGGQRVILERSYGQCPSCGQGFFPPG